ncbi:MAG: hypothetical protein R2845_00990 [Thermomicrobiales bacterium]
MATVLPAVDVVFVGFGLVGSSIAAELSDKTSLKMVALERGPYRDTFPDFLQDHFDEWRYAVQSELFQDLSRNTITFRNNDGQTALPMREYGSFLPGNGVGGAMVHWNGQSWRFLDHFFNYRSHLEERYGPDFLPEDTTIQDWPMTYADIEPFYMQYEKTFGIGGVAGNINGELQPDGNQFEGFRSEAYPQGPTKQTYISSLFAEAAGKLGYHTFPTPSGTSAGAYTNPYGLSLGPCNYCGFCERFGCHTGAKSEPDSDDRSEGAELRQSRDSPVLDRHEDQSPGRQGLQRHLRGRERPRSRAAGRSHRRRRVDPRKQPHHDDERHRHLRSLPPAPERLVATTPTRPAAPA